MQPINMIMIYYWHKKLKKRLHVLEADIIKIKKHCFDVSILTETFLLDVFQMIAIALVSVINYNHIDGLHLFRDTLYKIVLFQLFNFWFGLGS